MSKIILVGLSVIALSTYVMPSFAKTDASDFSWLKSNVATANTHIVPRYKALAKSSSKLDASVNKLCSVDGDVVLSKTVSKRFKFAYRDWAKVQYIKFGPVGFLKRLERIQYWPDKHNSSERQLRKLLTSIAQGESYSLSQFEKKSVAVQGFSALERVLFPKGGVISVEQCQLAKNITQNLHAIFVVLDENWRLSPVEYANEFALADRDSGTYGSSEEVVTILANALATQLLIISEYKLGRALPKKLGGRTFERQMEAWRSESSFELTVASLESLRSLYKKAFKPRLKTVNSLLSKRIEKQFGLILNGIKRKKQPMVELIKTTQGIAQIGVFKSQVETLEAMVRNEMFAELGFATRFNSLDGD